MFFFNKPTLYNWEIFLVRLNILSIESKRLTKDFFVNPIDLPILPKTIFLVIPIFFYFSCFNENKQQEINSFFDRTLPGFTNQCNKICWETFQKTNYLPIIPNSSSLSLQNKGKETLNSNQLENYQELLYRNTLINLKTWSQFLTIEFKELWQSYKKQFFFGIKLQYSSTNKQIKYIYPARENLVSDNYKNIYSPQKLKLNCYKFYQLDEYPLKVENIYTQKKFSTLPITINKLSQPNFPTIRKETKLLKTANSEKLSLIGVKITKHLKLKKNSLKVYNVEKKRMNSVVPNLNLTSKWKQLTKKLKQIKSETNYNLFSDLTIFTSINQINFINNKFKIFASHQILELLTEPNRFDSKSKEYFPEIQVNRIPLMSGFVYPDLSKRPWFDYNSKITKFFYPFFQNNILKFSTQIKIDFGHHFIYPEFYFYKPQQLTPLTFQYLPISFKARNGKLTYKGPGVLFPNVYNSNASLKNNYLLNTQTNLKNILGTSDPRQTRIDYSVSKLVNLLEPKKIASSELYNNFYQIAHQTNYLDIYLKNNCSSEKRHHKFFNPLLNLKSQYIVPFFDSNTWKTWTSQNSLAGNRSKGLIHSFPVRLSYSLKNSNLQSLYDLIDYQNSTRFFDSLNTNILSFEDLQTQSCSPQILEIRDHKNVIYQHQTSIYSVRENELNQNQQFLNRLLKYLQLETKTARTVWEPIHQTSWLIVNKFFLAILVIYLLQHFSREYGKELVAYLLDLFASVGIVDESLKEEVAPQTIKKTYRIIKNSKKNFQSIASINHIFSDIAEIVWFLRNSGRPFIVGNLVTKGILLVGAPGTGKTLLVQSIAGEAEVPVLVQAASTLQSLEGRGPQKLQILFEKARKLGSCIIFFDELDSIGEKRSQVIENPTGKLNVLSLLYWNKHQKNKEYYYGVPFTKKLGIELTEKKLTNLGNELNTEHISNGKDQSPEQLGLLMQLLIELDGLQINRRLIVIGATNRPEILDPALTRPGRLSKILEIGLPNKQNRIAICQLYSHSLGVSKNICWNTIAEQTIGLSGADLSTIMNQSTIQAILFKTKHTQKTIHLAIDKIIGCGRKNYDSITYINNLILKENIKTKNKNLNHHFIACSAYNQAGLKLLEYFLPHHKNPISAKLISIEKSERYKKQDLEFFLKTNQLTMQYKLQFLTKILANLAGKASEILFLNRSQLIKWTQLATLLNCDLNQLKITSNLIYFLISQEAFLPNDSPIFNVSLLKNQNLVEHIDKEITLILTNFATNYEKDLLSIEFSKFRKFQRWTAKTWWQIEISNLELSRNGKKPSWYRLFVMHPDNSTSSNERLAPDNYFHTNQSYFITRRLLFNDFYTDYRDRLYISMLHNSFQLATNLLLTKRVLLDFFVVLLIQKHILTQTELQNLFLNYQIHLKTLNFKNNTLNPTKKIAKKNYAWQLTQKPTTLSVLPTEQYL